MVEHLVRATHIVLVHDVEHVPLVRVDGLAEVPGLAEGVEHLVVEVFN
jgi:hypothetical protein